MSDHDKLREAIEQVRVLAASPLRSQAFPGLKYLTLLADAAESTLPKMTTIEAWHVEWFDSINGCPRIDVVGDRTIARSRELTYHQSGCRCVRVTGPHKHEVPA